LTRIIIYRIFDIEIKTNKKMATIESLNKEYNKLNKKRTTLDKELNTAIDCSPRYWEIQKEYDEIQERILAICEQLENGITE